MKLNTKRVVNLGLISKYRTELMGIATLLILICHAPANGFTLPTILDRAIRWGGIGVDFFLLFSGIGLYYSLKKTDNLLIWYKRRYLRIFVPFLLFAIPYYLFRKFIDGDSWLHFIGNITTLSFWTRHEGAWFVAMLVPLYLLTPLIAWFIDKAKNRWTPTIVLCVLSILGASIPTTNAIFDNIQMCLGHVSSFFIGYWIAKYVFEGKEIEFKWIYIYIPIFIVIYYFYRHLHISSNWMIVLPISILLTALFDYMGGGIMRSMVFLGTISLESYLANIFLPNVYGKLGLFTALSGLGYGNYLFYPIVVCTGVVLAYYAHQLCNKCFKWINHS